MKYKNKKQRLITYISKSLNKQKSYKIHNKDISVIIRCLKVQRYFLKRAKSQFEIQIDYKNLEYLIKA